MVCVGLPVDDVFCVQQAQALDAERDFLQDARQRVLKCDFNRHLSPHHSVSYRLENGIARESSLNFFLLTKQKQVQHKTANLYIKQVFYYLDVVSSS